MNSDAPRTLFISDLHLTPERPEITHAFDAFARGSAVGAVALYILGDLFEYWAGDDDFASHPLAPQVAARLAELAAGGTQIFFMAGNRDFLLGEVFADAARLSLLPDPSVVTLDGQQFVLAHGDALCTDDVAYQAMRRLIREPAWLAAALARPLAERKAMIADIRRKSEAAKQDKSAEIVDVNEDSVCALLRAHPDTILIHGHTHRPASHTHQVDGRARTRHVLSDWDDSAHYGEWSAGLWRVHTFHPA